MSVWRRDSSNRLIKINQSKRMERQVEIHLERAALPERTLRDYFSPFSTNYLSCIVLPETNATHFELNPSIIQLLPSFYGLEREDPYMHVKEFLDICSTFKFQNFSDESVRLRLFPFSLKDKAKAWLNSLLSRSITSWDQLTNKFITKFFPMSKTNALRFEISDFKQKGGEQFYECWERFKDLLLKCPHHNFELWRLVQYFYKGLSETNRHMVESMNKGAFFNLSERDAWQFFETLAENSQQWDFSNLDRTQGPKRGGLYEVRDDADVRSLLATLNRKVDALTVGQPENQPYPTHSQPSMFNNQESCSEQINAFQAFEKSNDSPFSSTYNPNWRNHPNFSWRQNQPQMNQGGQSFPVSNFQNVSQNPSFTPNFHQQRKPSLEETLQQFMQSTQQIMQSHSQAILKIENQVGQLATTLSEREKGKLPSQPIPNPKNQLEIQSSPVSNVQPEEVKSITTLRSGKIIDKSIGLPEKVKEKENVNLEKPNEEVSEKGKSIEKFLEEEQLQPYVPKAPFPQRLISKKKGIKYNDILEVFKQVSINIPFLDAIQQVPAYAKFLKDLCTIKRKTNVPKRAFLTEQISSIIQQKIPIKYKDPGCPVISCVIGDHFIHKALLDLGASVNLLPYSIYEKLGLGELKPSHVTLQLADRSVKIPRGIIEDVLIKVDKFYFPVDFIVLDTQPTENENNQIPVILGRPFLATSNAIVNCRNGVMKLSFGNMTIELNIFNANQRPLDYEDLGDINMIEAIDYDTFMQTYCDDVLEECLTHFGENLNVDNVVNEVNSLLESIPLMNISKWESKIKTHSSCEYALSSSANTSLKQNSRLLEKSSCNKKSCFDRYINELNKFRNEVYDNTKKVKMKDCHNKGIHRKSFKPGQKVFLCKSRLYLFPRELCSKCSGPFIVLSTFSDRIVEIQNLKNGKVFKIKNKRFKAFFRKKRKTKNWKKWLLEGPVYQDN